MDLSSKSTIQSLLQKHGLFAKKSFGQNFLVNEKAIQDIVNAAKITPEDTIIEVGPGLGVLTKELAKNAKNIISLELDKTLFPVLEETLEDFSNIEILQQDALKYIPPGNLKYKIVANIPYNITSHLINHFLQAENPPTSMTLLVQKEVAEKIVILNPDMTVLSLQAALFGEAKYIKKVPAGYFHPIPKVDSAILHITLFTKEHPLYISRNNAIQILKIAKICFSGRRKKLRNTLPKEYHENAISKGIDLSRRPETLSTQEWEAICLGDI